MKEIIYLNGEYFTIKEANISVLSPGLLCGMGVFETVRSYNKKIVYLDEHLKRLNNSCKLIGLKLKLSPANLKNVIKKTVEGNCLKDAYVRLTVWKSLSGVDISVIAKKYDVYPSVKYKAGFLAGVSTLRQAEGSLLAKIKTTSRLFYELCLKEARSRGCDEVVIINNSGYITEASRSNIFLVRNNELFTPFLECGCLDGITRRVIIDLAKKYDIGLHEGNFTLQNLYLADEAFLTNSLMGIMPLVMVEQNNIGKGKRGGLTELLMNKYNSLVKNGS
jgi:branched-chain amino acid aminotransferase